MMFFDQQIRILIILFVWKFESILCIFNLVTHSIQILLYDRILLQQMSQLNVLSSQ